MFQEASAEQGSASSTATEHADSAVGTKERRLEGMLQEACANTTPKLQTLLREVKTLGHYPKRYKQPANKAEMASNSLAKKLTMAKSQFTPAAQKYLEAAQAVTTEATAVSNATERAQQAEALMQQVREMGHLPHESQSKSKEQLLAQQLRKARANGLLEAFEEELQDLAVKDAEATAVSNATENAQQAEALMQQVREMGHLPHESQSNSKEQLLAQQLRKARANGLLEAFEEELQDLAVKEAEATAISNATENAQQAEALMQQIRALGRMPKESHDPKECRLARELRDARATGLMTSYEPELRDLEIKTLKLLPPALLQSMHNMQKV